MSKGDDYQIIDGTEVPNWERYRDYPDPNPFPGLIALVLIVGALFFMCTSAEKGLVKLNQNIDEWSDGITKATPYSEAMRIEEERKRLKEPVPHLFGRPLYTRRPEAPIEYRCGRLFQPPCPQWVKDKRKAEKAWSQRMRDRQR